MEFYKPNITKIGKDNFINFYKDCYYLNNSKYVEDEIDRLLIDGIKNEVDVIHILAWKIGKVNHKKSIDCFDYDSDWKDAEKLKVNRFGKQLNLSDFVKYIVTNINDLEQNSIDAPQAVLNKLKEYAPKGIGTVYLITLLYFISKGEYQIYDRFAMIALDAILGDKKPGDPIKYKELPCKDTHRFSNLIEDTNEGSYMDYCCKLEKIFGNNYSIDRDIDKALWCYGHLFNIQK